MSLARKHRAYHEALAAAAANPDAEGGLACLATNLQMVTEAAAGAAGREHLIAMARLTDDRRRLKEIQSVERKIEVKREMLPLYGDYVRGVLDAAEESGTALQDEVIATLMVWSIDVGAYPAGLTLAHHVLRHGLALPAHFQRTTPTLVAEEIAEAAIRQIGAGQTFPLDILLELDELVADQDMPDEVRAKLKKALGLTLAARAAAPDEGSGVAGEARAAQEAALAAFKRALELDQRAGVKKQIETLERALNKSEAFASDSPPAAPPADPDADVVGGSPPPNAG